MSDLGKELEAAWKAFSDESTPDLVARVRSAVELAHVAARARLAGEAPPPRGAVAPELAGAWALLDRDQEPLVAGPDLPVHVSDDGQIWGLGRYEHLDPRWPEALVAWLRHRHRLAPFRTAPRLVDVPDALTVAIAGDWGTGFFRPGCGAEGVARGMRAAAPDVTVHLGDTYYAGAGDEMRAKLVDVWPPGRLASIALPGNHELYSGAAPFYDVALAPDGPFHAQGGTSYVALRNRFWLVVGLDTAYHAGDMFEVGALDAAQETFLGGVARLAGARRVLLCTHHAGLSIDGDETTALWDQVVRALGRAPDVWYWGHAHNSVVYVARDGCRPRCAGHGAIPYAASSLLERSAGVVWSERTRADDPACPERVLNGWVRLVLDGPALTEQYFGEDGSLRWEGSGP